MADRWKTWNEIKRERLERSPHPEREAMLADLWPEVGTSPVGDSDERGVGAAPHAALSGDVSQGAPGKVRKDTAGVKVWYHRICPACGHPIAFVSLRGQGAWRHWTGYAADPVNAYRRGEMACGSLYPHRSPNGPPWIAMLIAEVRHRRLCGRRQWARLVYALYGAVVQPAGTRIVKVPGLSVPHVATVSEKELLRLRAAEHELQLQIERLQAQVEELQGQFQTLLEDVGA